MIDWPTVLREQGIPFVDKGPSTSKGNIYVRCPMCGSADQGHHMGISIHGKGWGCWRNRLHRGANPSKLLAALLNVSRQRADAILGLEGPTLLGDDDVKGKLEAMFGEQKPIALNKPILEFPKEMKALSKTNNGKAASKQMFQNYLIERGYPSDEVSVLAATYQLRYCLTGLFKYRLIFPVYTKLGLTTWTGRSIVPGREPRYLSLTSNPEVAEDGPLALQNIKDCLFNERWLYKQEGKALIVAEGPFDAMRLDYVGRQFHVHATGLFGKTVSDVQADKLEEIGKNYKRKFILLDPDAMFDRLSVYEQMKGIGFSVLKLYTGKGWGDDPGSTPIKLLKEFIKKEILF